MTVWYWAQRGGTLVEEFPVVARGDGNSVRLLDGLIVLDGEVLRLPPRTVLDLTGKAVVIVQAKNRRLGMSLMGQTLFSAELVRRYYRPSSVASIALCARTDRVLQPLLEAHEGCRVVECPPEVCAAVEPPGST